MNHSLGNVFRIVGVCAALSVLLAACLAHTPAPVSERSLVEGPMPDVYTVQKYDTLYSVAWRYELDVNELAARNRIKPPYVIETGQRIALTGTGPPPKPARPARPTLAPAKPSAANPQVEPDKPAGVKVPPAPVPEPAATPVVAPKPTASPAVTPTKPPAPQPAKTAPEAAPAKPAVADPTPAATARLDVPSTVAAGAWRRPVAAKPTRGFGGGSKGLDYSLRKGTLIQAAASGVVVYAGPGLGGFRHLVIVKASERHLVAYGVNVRPNLKEGDTVRIGDAVARAGSGTTGGQFHFEVRDGGKPIDPNSLLGS
ncbi:MAG: peptidoglycan DD-metalloendopeptidase family protein [Pseudomonadales bacterium]|nr:peptidoglycan DD-metalloendopeptidase family protein [Pseudomonadales bacterium]